MRIGNREFETKGHTYVMGILNVTPDSFSDGGRWNDRDRALGRVEEMLREGADIIDIGGESTRPGYTPVSMEEEIARTTPMIRAVKANFDVPVSLDTYKGKVAEAGIAAGADLINDIWGLKHDDKIARVISKSGLPCCLMHNREDADYDSFYEDVAADLSESLRLAERAGIDKGRIILDPGVGFAKSYEQNLEIIRHLESLHGLGCPILLGCSRKSVVGITLGLPVDQRMEGTLAATVVGVMKGCMFVRAHDIKENVRAIKMTEAILYGSA
ncbi:MAG: dihydropteroate synthase [Eubacterium sp.]|nr:dihydropteroate synthase [Eubacterium sp.]MCM1214670.1 dihydropteroate synthase [Lachnospiraceae bacterium]MCM1304975.1 dihydropteroate synthase [Butyrivibrio sp.]MCM1344508.1 dihydropteroate synthase [Muribaculaceae bacterium]MCM1239491.1 dihydropteroate synthase [Lachnospiraceae bacterium]